MPPNNGQLQLQPPAALLLIGCKILLCQQCDGDLECPKLKQFERDNHAALTAPEALLRTARLVALWFPRLGDVAEVADTQMTFLESDTPPASEAGAVADFEKAVGAAHDRMVASDYAQARAREERRAALAKRRIWRKKRA